MAQQHGSTQHTLLCSMLLVWHEHCLSLHALLLAIIIMTRSMRFIVNWYAKTIHACSGAVASNLQMNLACMPGISDTLMDFG